MLLPFIEIERQWRVFSILIIRCLFTPSRPKLALHLNRSFDYRRLVAPHSVLAHTICNNLTIFLKSAGNWKALYRARLTIFWRKKRFFVKTEINQFSCNNLRLELNKMFLKIKLLFLTFLVVVDQVLPFELIKFAPKNSSSIEVNSGHFIELSCQVDAYLRNCIWRSNKDQICEFTYSRTAKDVVLKHDRCSIGRERWKDWKITKIKSFWPKWSSIQWLIKRLEVRFPVTDLKLNCFFLLKDKIN